jgi:hypothetical protein
MVHKVVVLQHIASSLSLNCVKLFGDRVRGCGNACSSHEVVQVLLWWLVLLMMEVADAPCLLLCLPLGEELDHLQRAPHGL